MLFKLLLPVTSLLLDKVIDSVMLSELRALDAPHLPPPSLRAPPPPQASVPSQLSKRLVKISPDEELNPGLQRQVVALTHTEFRGHQRAQAVGAEAAGMETMVRRLKE